MKKIFYLALLLSFFACHKDNKPSPSKTDKKTYTVSFNVSMAGMIKSNSIGAGNNAVIPVSDFANSLQYWVYNSSGQLVTQLLQTKSTTNFGHITDSFSAGTYNVVIVAQNHTDTTFIPLFPSSAYSNEEIVTGGNDTFVKNYSLTVSDTTAEQNITLDRIDGELQVEINDAIAATTAQIEVDVLYDKGFSIAADTPTVTHPIMKIISIPSSEIGKSNFIITTYITNTTSPFTVNIYAINSSGTKFEAATATNVTCQKNVRTLVSGNLFTTIPTNGFAVTFDDNWDGNPTIIPFNSK